MTVERTRFQTWPQERPVAVSVRFGLSGFGTIEETYHLDNSGEIQAWLGNNRGNASGCVQLGLRELKEAMPRRDFVLFSRKCRKAHRYAKHNPLGKNGDAA